MERELPEPALYGVAEVVLISSDSGNSDGQPPLRGAVAGRGRRRLGQLG